MFALRVTYLTGRVCAAVFDDGDSKLEPEWPPHPSRLFSALVAAWGDGGGEEELRAPLKWLETLKPPSLLADECSPRELVQAYVPVNDSRGTDALPDERPRKGRTFPSASLSDPNVYFVWDEDIPAELRTGMDTLLARTSSLGHSSSLVSIQIVGDIPNHLERREPEATEGTRLRVPYPGRFRELEKQYERFRSNPTKVNRPGRGRTSLYAKRPAAAVTAATRGIFREMFILRRTVGPPVQVTGALQVMAAFRGAMMSLSPQPCPEIISGHAPESTPERPIPSQRPHLAIIPLPFAGSPYATGEVMGVAALLPNTIDGGERDALITTLHRVSELRMSWGVWKMERATAEERRFNLRQEAWTAAARAWATVTPFVFDRYPKDVYGEEAQEIVTRAVERIGLPKPVSVAVVKTSPHFGVPPAPAFPVAGARQGKPQRFHSHVILSFRDPVGGPIVAGAGRYYGYGLFRALGD